MFIIIANILRRKIPFLRKSLIPTALIGGMLALGLSYIPIGGGRTLLGFIEVGFLEMITYHAVALGFITLSLRQIKKTVDGAKKVKKNGLNSGGTIVGTLLLQGIIGLTLTIILALIFKNLFEGSGILLAVGYGQGPGQSFNLGGVFDETIKSLGLGTFASVRSFALAICSIGTLVSCMVCIIYINILRRKGKLTDEQIKQNAAAVDADPADEMPLTEPVDRMTMNISTIMFVFLVTSGVMFGLNWLVVGTGLLGDMGETITPVIFGFNFIFGTLIAIAYRKIFTKLKSKGLIKHEYTNNTTLNRIAGAIFDFMIICSVLLIVIGEIWQVIIPLVIICVVGAVATFFYIRFVAKHIAKGYETQYFVGFFANQTGTIAQGMGMIRLVDPNFKTPASEDLVVGSAFAVVLGFPLMFLIPMAITEPILVLGIMIAFFACINLVLFRKLIFKKRKGKKDETAVKEEEAVAVQEAGT
jgi:ESS family glutamate:Na+ symporter